jgi:hypothetical protein
LFAVGVRSRVALPDFGEPRRGAGRLMDREPNLPTGTWFVEERSACRKCHNGGEWDVRWRSQVSGSLAR